MPWGRKPILLREDCGIGGRLCLSSKMESQTLIRRRERCFYRPLHAVYIQHTLDKDHGRVEERIYTALRPQEVLDESQYESWKNIQVERLVTFSDGTERRDKQYYLSSLPAEAVERIGTYIRGPLGNRKQIALAS